MWTTSSGSKFYQWVWVLSMGLDFASGSGFVSGSGYENPMGQTLCCIMWSTHNHGITPHTYLKRLSYSFLQNLSQVKHLLSFSLVVISHLLNEFNKVINIFHEWIPGTSILLMMKWIIIVLGDMIGNGFLKLIHKFCHFRSSQCPFS